LYVLADQDVALNHVADSADSQVLYYAVMEQLQVVLPAATADVVCVATWGDWLVQVFANLVKVAVTEVAKV
jgi:hypothetical protein